MEEGETKDVTGSPTHLYIAAVVSNILFISAGCVMAWTSPTLPKLRESGAISKDQEALIGSLFSFGAAFGPVISAFGIDRIGRKGTIYVIASCFFVSWIILTTSQNFYVICIARIVGGVGVGGAFTSLSVFIAEIADNERRGSVGSLIQIFVSLGFMVEYCIGPYVSYIVLIVVSWIMIVTFFVLFYFLPESPYYLLASGQRDEAMESLSWYRGKPTTVEPELAEIEDLISQSPQQGFVQSIRILCMKTGPRKGLLISLYLLILQQGSAFNAIIVYTQDIFSTTKMTLPSEYSAMILGLTNVVSALPSPFLVRRFGLKPVLICSGLGMGVCFGFLGLYFYLIQEHYDVSNLDFLPIMSLIASNVFFCSGLGSLPWAYVAELFPLEIKSHATAICGYFSFIFGFGVISVFSIIFNDLGAFAAFVTLFVFMTLGSIGAFFFLPHTKGMSLQQIQDYLGTGEKLEDQ